MSAADHETALREEIEDALGELCGNADIRFGNESDRIAEKALAALDALVGLLRQTEQERDEARQVVAADIENAALAWGERALRAEQEVERLKRENQERETANAVVVEAGEL